MRIRMLAAVVVGLVCAAPSWAQTRVTGADGAALASEAAMVDANAALTLLVDDFDFIRTNLGIDNIHDNAVTSSGPLQMLEYALIDGSALPNVVGAEGDAVRHVGSASGVAYVTLTDVAGLSSAIVLEDVASAAADALVRIACIRDDTLDARSGTEGDYEMCHLNAAGAMWTIDVNSAAVLTALQTIDNLATDPCASTAKTYIPIDVTTATTTELTGALAGASNYYYVCALNLVTDAANDISLVDDDTDGCGSPTAGLAGGLTAAEGWNFAANGGMTLGSGGSSVMRSVTQNAVLCLVTGAATQVGGHLVVVAAP